MIYRGNIMEVKEDSFVVMLDDCTFQRVKKYKGLQEGMEIYFEDRDIIKKTSLNLKNIGLIVASIFLFIATAFYGIDIWSTNYRAVALVSVDINPSVEIKINKNHNVINAIALNEDAKKLPLKNLKNQPIDNALQELVNMARVEGYIKEEKENYILVTSVDLIEDTEEEKILTNLIEGGKEKIESSSLDAGEQVEVIAIQSNKETLKEAKKENISVGKREIFQNSRVNEIKDMSNNRKKDKLNKYLNEMKEEKDNLDKYLKDIKKEKERPYKYLNEMKEEKDRVDKHLKDMENEANELVEKLKELQQNKQNNKINKYNNGNGNRNNNKNNKSNTSDSRNNNKNINKYNQIINEGQDRLKEIINLQQNKRNIKLREEKPTLKRQMLKDSKRSKDKSKQEPNKTQDNNGKVKNK